MTVFRERLTRTLLLMTLLFVAGGAAADLESSWLPPQVEEGTVQQLAERMKLLGEGAPNDDRVACRC